MVGTTADDEILGVTSGRRTLRRVIFIIIESGIALFAIQLARVVASIFDTDTAAHDAFYLIVAIHQMLNVIIKSVIATLFY